MKKTVIAFALVALAFASCKKETPEAEAITVPTYLRGTEWTMYKRELIGAYIYETNEDWDFRSKDVVISNRHDYASYHEYLENGTHQVTSVGDAITIGGINYTFYKWDRLSPDSFVIYLNEGIYAGDGLHFVKK